MASSVYNNSDVKPAAKLREGEEPEDEVKFQGKELVRGPEVPGAARYNIQTLETDGTR